MSRDYCAEMRAVIDQHTGGGSYVPRVAATEIVEKLRATDRELLRGWLNEQAEQFVWQAINDRDRSTRASVRHGRKRKQFAEAAGQHAAGSSGGLRDFLRMPFSVEDGSRQPLAKLNGADLTFVAGTYRARERENALTATFLEALAKKVGTDTVEQHYTNEQLSAMFDSLH